MAAQIACVQAVRWPTKPETTLSGVSYGTEFVARQIPGKNRRVSQEGKFIATLTTSVAQSHDFMANRGDARHSIANKLVLSRGRTRNHPTKRHWMATSFQWTFCDHVVVRSRGLFSNSSDKRRYK